MLIWVVIKQLVLLRGLVYGFKKAEYQNFKAFGLHAD